jgi:hypothetical protein
LPPLCHWFSCILGGFGIISFLCVVVAIAVVALYYRVWANPRGF